MNTEVFKLYYHLLFFNESHPIIVPGDGVAFMRTVEKLNPIRGSDISACTQFDSWQQGDKIITLSNLSLLIFYPYPRTLSGRPRHQIRPVP